MTQDGFGDIFGLFYIAIYLIYLCIIACKYAESPKLDSRPFVNGDALKIIPANVAYRAFTLAVYLSQYSTALPASENPYDEHSFRWEPARHTTTAHGAVV